MYIQRRPLLKHEPQSPIACSHTLLAGDFSCAYTHLLIFLSQHPSLPVPLFPRYSQSSLRTSAAPSLSLSPDMQVDTFFYLNPLLFLFLLELHRGRSSLIGCHHCNRLTSW